MLHIKSQVHFPLAEQSEQGTRTTKELFADDKMEILSWQEALPEIVLWWRLII